MKKLMTILILIIILLLTGSAGVIGQTPYDSFAPEAWRPILGDDATLTIDVRNESVSDSVVEFVVVDIASRQVLLVNSSNQVLAVMQVEEDDVKWLSPDPMADKYPWINPYAYANNNPIVFLDPNGMWVEVAINDDGTYKITDGIADDDRNIYITQDGNRTGEILGQMATNYSFFDENNNIVSDAVINMQDLSGEKFLADFMKNMPSLVSYVFGDDSTTGRNGGRYDFKISGFPYDANKKFSENDAYRGMPIVVDGKKVIGSARDVGNYAAGYIAGISGIPYAIARIGFDKYNKIPEPAVSQAAQILGHNSGYMQYLIFTTNINPYNILCR